MNETLRKKWKMLRLMKLRGMYEINYRLLRNTAKLMGIKHAI